MQTQIQKALSQYDFLTSSMYEVNDLTNQIGKEDKFIVRQGDLIVTNHEIPEYRKRGLRRAWLGRRNRTWIYMGSHFIIPLKGKTLLVHNEHGIVVIPRDFHELEVYTFGEAGD